MGSFTPCQPVYFYIFQTFFCEMTKRQQLKQQQQQQNVATQIGQFWTPIMCDWTANFQQIILKHNGKKQVLNWHQECYASTIERDIPLGSSIQKFLTMQKMGGVKSWSQFANRYRIYLISIRCKNLNTVQSRAEARLDQ